MRAYTTTCLVAGWLSSVVACSLETGAEPGSGVPTLPEEKQADAGQTSCDLRATWDVTLSTEETCSPEASGAAISLRVDDSGSDSDDFTYAELPAPSPCGPYDHRVQIAAEGCTINASSLATWCASDRPQCRDYELTLHVRADGHADVAGSYRRCWCGSPSSFGKKVVVAGSAVRR